MEYNELEKTENTNHLLKWVTAQNTSEFWVHSLQQLREQPAILGAILCALDEPFFSGLVATYTLDTHYPRYLEAIEDYFEKTLAKKIKRRFRSEILDNECTFSFTCLLLYGCVHSMAKEEFITTILSLQPDTQTGLMKIISDIGKQIENIMDIKEILEKVEELEYENDTLKGHLVSMSKSNQELKENIKLLNHSLKAAEDECEGYRKEKAETLKELNIENLNQDYVTMYRRLRNQNAELLKNLETLQNRNCHLSSEITSYQAQAKDDNELINELNEEILRIKGVCKTLRLSSSLSIFDCDMDEPTNQFSDRSILKENKTYMNTRSSLKSLTMNSKKRLSLQTEDITENEEYIRLKYEYHQLLDNYENIIDHVSREKEVAQEWQNKYEKLLKDHNYLRGMMGQLKNLHGSLTKFVKASTACC